MITAEEARKNVANYTDTINANIDKKVDEMVEIICHAIKFNSENGYSAGVFYPYEKSRFSNVYALERAQERFTKIFEDAGFEILENNYGKNLLRIKW